MKSILVPTDFSENCDKAANLGIQMAKQYNAEIHFFHLIHTPVDWVKLDKLKEKRYPDTLRKIGSAKSALRARELFGSNIEKIVRKSDVPVIVVKEDEVSLPFKNIVFVSDFMEDVSGAFVHVISIAKKCNAHIRLLRINTQTDTNSISAGLNPIKRFLEKFPDLKNYSMYVNNEPSVETGINTFLRQEPADLIAMSTHGSTGFLSLFSKSIAEGIANHSSLPVMTVKI